MFQIIRTAIVVLMVLVSATIIGAHILQFINS